MVTGPLPAVAPTPRRPLPATQAEVASLVGCCRQTVAKWQKGWRVLPIIDTKIRRVVRQLELKQAQNIEI